MVITKHLTVILFLTLKVLAWSKTKINILQISVDVAKDYADVNFTISKTGAASAYVITFKDLEIFADGVVKYSPSGSKNSELVFLNRTLLDVCEFLQNPRYEPMGQLMYKLALESPNNIPKRCPIKKNILYYIKNFQVNTDRLPPIFPQSKLRLLTNISAMENGNLHKIAEIMILGELQRE